MRTRFFLLFILMVLCAGTLSAQGVIIPQPGVFTDPSWLKIDFVRVQATIENQIATTEVDMQFTNQGEALAEGTFVFPLPEGAAVDRLVMFVDGEPIEAKILRADEARQIYDEIVRQYRDPALLEYIGQGAIQANIFPIPPGDSRRVQITYGQVLEADNGLIHYLYPIHASANADRLIEQMSISVRVTGDDPISTIYSPSHRVAINRENTGFSAGWEASFVQPGDDFSLFYGLDNEAISVNLLTYRESAGEDGFFMLLVQPPLDLPEDQIISKDVIVVLDQSGSMQGEKWDQARAAATYVLENLKPQDRFNMVVFSTGARTFSLEMEPAEVAGEAVDWIDGMYAEGGTDINLALIRALEMAHPERSTTILFLTDGLPTEGVIEADNILANLGDMIQPNVRIFTFGVGNDVDTFLLDSIVQDFRGTGSYVRPTERIDEEVASLYNKISAPVLTNPELRFDSTRVELLYPAQLPDLFAGEQLTVVGRYRDSSDNVIVRLQGTVNGEAQTFVYDELALRGRAGGEDFIPRLWATRRIGDLLNSIRLNGENPELVDSVVSLSLRYGIITPYTSFLIEEDDILSQQGRDRVTESFRQEAEELAEVVTGEDAVAAADDIGNLAGAAAPQAMPTQTMPAPGSVDKDADGTIAEPQTNALQTVGSKTFIWRDSVWTDTSFQPDTMETEKVVFLSDAYFALLDDMPEVAQYLALGDHVIIVIDGTAYEVLPE